MAVSELNGEGEVSCAVVRGGPYDQRYWSRGTGRTSIAPPDGDRVKRILELDRRDDTPHSSQFVSAITPIRVAA